MRFVPIRAASAPLLLALALAPTAGAQSQPPLPGWPVTDAGAPVGSEFGFRVEIIGDYDGDSVADVFIGAPNDGPPATSGAGWVYSGTGAVIASYFGTLPSQSMGIRGAGADLDGDGVLELLVSSPGPSPAGPGQISHGFVNVFRLASGLVATIGAGATTTGSQADAFGASLAVLGDLTGDGNPEVAIGAPLNGTTIGGRVRIYDGASLLTGSPTSLTTLVGTDVAGRFGYDVAALDLDLDGNATEIAVGAPSALNGRGRVTIFDASSGSVLSQHLGASSLAQFGHSLADVGDLNQDGIADVLVGAPTDERPGQAGKVGSASVLNGAFVLDPFGAPQETLATYYGDDLYRQGNVPPTMDGFGFDVANAGDLDGDGTNDLLIAAPNTTIWDPDFPSNGWPSGGLATTQIQGAARLVSGRTGIVLKQYAEPVPTTGDGFASSVAGGRDVDGDGVADLVFGVTAASSGPGRVYAWSGAYWFGQLSGPTGTNSTGGPATMMATGSQSWSADRLFFRITGLPANETGQLICATMLVPPIPAGGGFVLIGPIIYYGATAPFGTANGTIVVHQSIGALPVAVIGPLARTYFQFLYTDSAAGGRNLSNAVNVGLFQ